MDRENLFLKLKEAEQKLGLLCDLIEQEGENAEVDKVFFETRIDMATGISWLICVFDMCLEALKTHKRAKACWPELAFKDGLRPRGVALTGTVEARDLMKHRIDERYFQAKTHYILLVDKIREELTKGARFSWVDLTKK
jgi:hypothetical protein